ncbi:hypothetical protein [Paraburkholderia aromaticivorans]|uniref:hypothetical protein n=1 Tax=Paraburkholderia aromaticivorans TaxID=2026199 RepID=UPI0038BBDBBC
MNASGTITMTMREVDQLRTIQSVVDGMLMTWQAAERLPATANLTESCGRFLAGAPISRVAVLLICSLPRRQFW